MVYCILFCNKIIKKVIAEIRVSGLKERKRNREKREKRKDQLNMEQKELQKK